MYRERILNTKTPHTAAARLKKVMLEYHDFRLMLPKQHLNEELIQLTRWQSNRLRQTHQDLYKSPEYAQGLQFLLSELYSPKDFSGRDRDLERILPKMIKLLPKQVIETVSLLVELNLVTQMLDHQLAQTIFKHLKYTRINEAIYCQAYRHCNNFDKRNEQIQLTAEVGKKLDRYARSKMINISLKLSKKPAEMAGLSALYSFIMRGFTAFHSMHDIDYLMSTITQRETQILDNIYQCQPHPFVINPGMVSGEALQSGRRIPPPTSQR